MTGKIFKCGKDSELSEDLANKYGLFQTQLRSLGKLQPQSNFGNFSTDFSLEAVLPAVELTQNYYNEYEHFFFLKTCHLIINKM